MTDEGKGSTNMCSTSFDLPFFLIALDLCRSCPLWRLRELHLLQLRHNIIRFLRLSSTSDTFPHPPAHLFVPLFWSRLTSIKEDLIGGRGVAGHDTQFIAALLYPSHLSGGFQQGLHHVMIHNSLPWLLLLLLLLYHSHLRQIAWTIWAQLVAQVHPCYCSMVRWFILSYFLSFCCWEL